MRIHPQAARSSKVPNLVSRLVTSVADLFRPHSISAIPFMLRTKLETVLKAQSRSDDGIYFVFKVPDIGDTQTLKRNLNMVELSWSQDSSEFGDKNGILIMRYFDPDSNAIIMKPCDVVVTNRFSLKQLTNGVIDSLKAHRMDVKESLWCELETKAIVLQHEFQIPVVRTVQEAFGKNALLLKSDGRLTLYRENYLSTEVKSLDRDGADCTVFADSIDDIRKAVQHITNKQNEDMFSRFPFYINVPGMKLQRVREEVLQRQFSNSESLVLVSVDQASDKAVMVEPQQRIHYTWGVITKFILKLSPVIAQNFLNISKILKGDLIIAIHR